MDDTHDSLKTQRWNARPVRTHGPAVFNGYCSKDPSRLLLFFILPRYVLPSKELLGERKAIERIYCNRVYGLAGGLIPLVVMVVSSMGRTVAPIANPAPAVRCTCLTSYSLWRSLDT